MRFDFEQVGLSITNIVLQIQVLYLYCRWSPILPDITIKDAVLIDLLVFFMVRYALLDTQPTSRNVTIARLRKAFYLRVILLAIGASLSIF